MNGNILILNQWRIEMTTGDVWHQSSAEESTPVNRIEPKAIQLLAVLAETPNQLVDKQQLLDTLWPRQALTDEPLTRCVSRLRKTLHDNPKKPQFIETLPKRGYRLIATIVEWQQQNVLTATPGTISTEQTPTKHTGATPKRHIATLSIMLLLAAIIALALWRLNLQDSIQQQQDAASSLVQHADDYYLQMRRQDNEMAIELYQQAIALRPESGVGLAGLANALVQQVIRWPAVASDTEMPLQNLKQALDEGRHKKPASKQKLARALALAQQAVTLAPEQPASHKALGFVYAASAEFDLAQNSYQRAIALDADAWDALINLGDILEIQGQLPLALPYYEKAFAAMGRVYHSQSARIQPWYADMGALIGEKYQQLNQLHQAESWYRHVLSFAPFNLRATKGLANMLHNAGDAATAKRLCQEYHERIGQNPCV